MNLIFLKFHIFCVNYVLKWTSVPWFQVFLIISEFLVAPTSFGQNGDEGRWCIGGESFKSEITSMIKQHIGMLKMIFAKKHGVAIM